jgi:putative hydrolase
MKFVLDTHCHTVSSGHAYSTIEELAKQASERGLELIAMTDHTEAMPGGAHVFHFNNLRIIPDEIYGVEVLKGAETNIIDYDGNVDLNEDSLAQLDVVIASFHPPCIKPGTKEQNTQALLGVIKNPHIDIIGHPGDARYPLDFKKIVKAAKEYHTLLEINNSSLRPQSFRPGGKENIYRLLEECMKQQVPVIIGSDAHISFDVGNFDAAKEMLEQIGMPEELVVNTSVQRLKDFLKYKNS